MAVGAFGRINTGVAATAGTISASGWKSPSVGVQMVVIAVIGLLAMYKAYKISVRLLFRRDSFGHRTHVIPHDRNGNLNVDRLRQASASRTGDERLRVRRGAVVDLGGAPPLSSGGHHAQHVNVIDTRRARSPHAGNNVRQEEEGLRQRRDAADTRSSDARQAYIETPPAYTKQAPPPYTERALNASKNVCPNSESNVRHEGEELRERRDAVDTRRSDVRQAYAEKPPSYTKQEPPPHTESALGASKNAYPNSGSNNVRGEEAELRQRRGAVDARRSDVCRTYVAAPTVRTLDTRNNVCPNSESNVRGEGEELRQRRDTGDTRRSDVRQAYVTAPTVRTVVTAPTARTVDTVPTARTVDTVPTARTVVTAPTARTVVTAPTARTVDTVPTVTVDTRNNVCPNSKSNVRSEREELRQRRGAVDTRRSDVRPHTGNNISAEEEELRQRRNAADTRRGDARPHPGNAGFRTNAANPSRRSDLNMPDVEDTEDLSPEELLRQRRAASNARDGAQRRQ